MAKPQNVRKNLPPGVNAEDMKDNGDRWCLLRNYGPDTLDTVKQVMRAWGVKKWWLINKRDTTVGDGTPVPSFDGGPEYMLLFADGKWRHATFRGINGPPCANCWWEPWDAPNGEAAFHQMILAMKIKHRVDKEAEVARLAQEVAERKELLSRSMQKPERSDETWK